MATAHRASSNLTLLAVKGSPADLITRAASVLDRGEIKPLDARQRDIILQQNNAWAAHGLRVLGVACAQIEPGADLGNAMLVWLGLVAMSDPLRPGVEAVMARLHDAGIRPVMITGDQAATASSIGSQLQLAPDSPLRIVEASEASGLTPEMLRALAERTHVFARATPSFKLSIVRALQDRGRIVAMTGDGINDGPALRAANVGVAMGGARQDVAKSVSDLVLENDGLDALLTAIGEGRTIYDNIRKAIRYLLATNFSEIQTMVAALAVGLPVPLNPMQLLWINLLTDILPALSLALEPAEADVLRTKPRDARRPLLGGQDTPRLIRESVLLSGAAMASYLYGIRRYGAGPQASTQAFATLTLAQLLHAVSCRSERTGLFDSQNRPRNPMLDLSLAGVGALQIGSMFLPWTRRLLGTSPVGVLDIAVIGSLSVAPLIVNELLNQLERQKRKERAP
jgi:Ca2+-transporting ATPase